MGTECALDWDVDGKEVLKGRTFDFAELQHSRMKLWSQIMMKMKMGHGISILCCCRAARPFSPNAFQEQCPPRQRELGAVSLSGGVGGPRGCIERVGEVNPQSDEKAGRDDELSVDTNSFIYGCLKA
ncbi:hypothetical protein BDR07DRAFT_1382540 [Suillus spraguei]|nr:hypothetical protein BDR07DRAFT_1382540 [Suillus spraguei]